MVFWILPAFNNPMTASLAGLLFTRVYEFHFVAVLQNNLIFKV
jgi:hypothetical protein